MTSGRLRSRLRVFTRAAFERTRRPRRPPERIERVLVAHHLLLGDTLMLTPLIAKLRALHPRAEIVMTIPKAIMPLYGKRPYGLVPVAYDPRDPNTLSSVFQQSDKHGGYDIAFVPGDNRYSWLALAAGARWIVAFGGDRPAYKSWPVDELRHYPEQPGAWGDLIAELLEGAAPPPYQPSDWPAPDFQPFELPKSERHAVLHVGASSPLKLWEAGKWRALAVHLELRGDQIVFLAGRGEERAVANIDPDRRWTSYAGQLDLAQVWHLLAGAALLVCPDTGIAHLGRIIGVPTVALFGPGSDILCGAGDFWRASPYRSVTVPEFPCRDQQVLFKREIEWVRRCGRGFGTGPNQCPAPRCMQAIDVARVERAVESLTH